MNKLPVFILIISVLWLLLPVSSAQEAISLNASLNIYTPESKSIPQGAQMIDVTRINLEASGGDVYLTGIYMGTDVSGGLSNFINLYLYDVTSTTTQKGIYPNQSSNPNLIQFNYIRISPGYPKTFQVRASLSDTAAGNIRVGFSGFTFSTLAAPTLVNVPIYGNVMTLPGPTPTPTPTPTPQPSPTPTPTPVLITPSSLGFTSLSVLNLSEGDTISATGSADPDIYIANAWGYKRLFLNPVIFGFYAHLGGFANVKNIASSTRNMLVTSGLFRNCETNDAKVYGVEVTGEDAGILHWVNTSGAQAVMDDPDFFKKVFCINSAEFNWYSIGSEYTSVNQVPNYSR